MMIDANDFFSLWNLILRCNWNRLKCQDSFYYFHSLFLNSIFFFRFTGEHILFFRSFEQWRNFKGAHRVGFSYKKKFFISLWHYIWQSDIVFHQIRYRFTWHHNRFLFELILYRRRTNEALWNQFKCVH